MEKISVGLTVYNEEKGVKRVLDYISSQKHLIHDVVVVSDSCIDKTNHIILDWWEQETQGLYGYLVFCKHRLGRAQAIRTCIAATEKDVMAIFAGDIQPQQDSLEKLIHPFENPKVGAVTGHPKLLNPERTVADVLSRLMWDSHGRVGAITTKRGEFFHLSGEMFALRKSALKGFETYRGLTEDAMIGWCIKQSGYEVLWTDEVSYTMQYPSSLKGWLRIRRRCCYGRVDLAAKCGLKSYPFYELSHNEYLVNVAKVCGYGVKRWAALPVGIFLDVLCRIYYSLKYREISESKDTLKRLWVPSGETKW